MGSPPSIDEGPERYRARLFGIAYRMLGDVQDAEDLVQEAMLRWQRQENESPARVREPEGWLVAVVTRLAIDRLRHLATERAAYPGPWLPEPVAPERLAPDYRAELASDLSMAFLVMLERLAPEERAAFLLREVFAADYDEIARVLGKGEAAARQTVHRARERVRADRPRFAAPPPDAAERLFHRFVAALETEDKESMLALLAADASWTSDGGGKVSAARRVVRGADRIARMLLGIEAKYARPFTYRLARLNGEPAVVQYVGDRVFAATFCETDGERLTALYRVMNPEKLRLVD
ncbi:MAG TPA: RNA polymerase sigma factor SigJ [Gemmatimonadaceae bacterium]|nr:RNA polymerase sigma factor SigJ [Gemmatimonadaceae bacterium]